MSCVQIRVPPHDNKDTVVLREISKILKLRSLEPCENLIQWNPGLTICQGNVKIISLNRDIVIAEFPV